MKKKIIGRINLKTGVLTLETEGYEGASCLEATRRLEEGLGMDVDMRDLKPEFYTGEQQVQEDKV